MDCSGSLTFTPFRRSSPARRSIRKGKETDHSGRVGYAIETTPDAQVYHGDHFRTFVFKHIICQLNASPIPAPDPSTYRHA